MNKKNIFFQFPMNLDNIREINEMQIFIGIGNEIHLVCHRIS